MVLIVNGRIINESFSSVTISGSPRPGRRNSFQELSQQMQLQEQRKEQLFQDYVATAGLPPSHDLRCAHCGLDPAGPAKTRGWKERLSQTALVFGFNLPLFLLTLFMGVSVLLAGLHGLMVTLLLVYLGTVYSSQAIPVHPPPAERQPLTKDNYSTGEFVHESSLEDISPLPTFPRINPLRGSTGSLPRRRNSFAGPGFRLSDSLSRVSSSLKEEIQI